MKNKYLEANDEYADPMVIQKYESIYEQLNFDNNNDAISFSYRLDDAETAWHIILTNNTEPELFGQPISEYAAPYVYYIKDLIPSLDKESVPTLRDAVDFLVYVAIMGESEALTEDSYDTFIEGAFTEANTAREELKNNAGSFDNTKKLLFIIASVLILSSNTTLTMETSSGFSVIDEATMKLLLMEYASKEKLH
jgi:hypothetical protein